MNFVMRTRTRFTQLAGRSLSIYAKHANKCKQQTVTVTSLASPAPLKSLAGDAIPLAGEAAAAPVSRLSAWPRDAAGGDPARGAIQPRLAPHRIAARDGNNGSPRQHPAIGAFGKDQQSQDDGEDQPGIAEG